MKLTALGWRRLGLGLLGAISLAALGLVAMRAGPLAPSRVTVVTATAGTLTPALFGIGTVEARRAYLIGPTTAGRVAKVLVDVGEEVEPGQLLAEMDPIDLEQRSAAMAASIARANSSIAAAQAQRTDAVARQTLAALNARRYVELGEENFISASAVQAKLQERASADAGVSSADAALAAARQDLQRLSAERAALHQQRASLRLLAPAGAVVVSRDAEAGSTVVAGQAVLRLVEPSSLWVRVRLDQGRSAGLAAGLPATLVLRSDPSRSWPGKVARVEATSDSVTEERVAMVSFDERPLGVSIGELAEVTLSLPGTPTSVLLPNASIRRQGDQAGVWRVEKNGPRFAPVRTGQAGLDGQVQVLHGVAAGEAVVLHSEGELAAGRRVRVVDALGAGKS
jgi:HlyD family secretion protein